MLSETKTFWLDLLSVSPHSSQSSCNALVKLCNGVSPEKKKKSLSVFATAASPVRKGWSQPVLRKVTKKLKREVKTSSGKCIFMRKKAKAATI